MASVALSNISIVQFNQSKISISGFAIECYRIAAGQVAGDTVVLPFSGAPTRERGNVRAVYGPVTHNLTTPASAVTVTLTGVFTSAVSNTIGAVDVWLVYDPR